MSRRPQITISAVQTSEEEERLVLEVLRSGHLAQGPMVERLEEQFASLAGTRHAVALSSGTTALVATLKALGLGPGDEVITSPLTFAATLNAIIETGASARFADIGEDFNVRPDAVEALVGERTKALMPVHLYGYPADMTAIRAIAQRHGLAIVEDAAQAIGASVADRPVGSFGHGCFSLYATKNITSGEGGIVTTDDTLLAGHLRVLRNQGMRSRYEYIVPGHNYRMTDLQAAVAVGQLGRLPAITEARQRNGAQLSTLLADTPGLRLPDPNPDRRHVFHQYTVMTTRSAASSRDGIVDELTRHGIQAGIYYPRVVFDYACYRDLDTVVIDPVPNAVEAAQCVFSLPVHPGVGPTDLEYVADTLRRVLAP